MPRKTNKRKAKKPYEEPAHPTWEALLKQAVEEPGTVSKAYSMFHDYSFGNMMLVAAQLLDQGKPFQPVATYDQWIALGRQVRKDEHRSIVMCLPTKPKTITKTRTDKVTGEEVEDKFTFQRFIYRMYWFAMDQTDGEDYKPTELPSWSEAKALVGLGISVVPFTALNGNVMGYAKDREVAINPLNPHGTQTLLHELAHIVLGHTDEVHTDTGDRTPRNLREAEAESTAMLVAEALGFEDHAESRGYIQNWYGSGNPIPEQSAQRIFKAANRILKAGQPETGEEK